METKAVAVEFKKMAHTHPNQPVDENLEATPSQN